jgi:hypothetical protein
MNHDINDLGILMLFCTGVISCVLIGICALLADIKEILKGKNGQ